MLSKMPEIKNPKYQKYKIFHTSKCELTAIYTAINKEEPLKKVVIKRTFFNKQGVQNQILKNLAIQEIKTLEKIQNKNVVAHLDHFEDENSIYLVEEFCNRLDLGLLFQSRNNKLKEEEVKVIGKQILNGLQGLHKNGVIHRDLRIANILVHEEQFQVVKISGLTMSKLLMDRSNQSNQSNQTQPNYDSLDTIAPEVILNQKYGLSVDIFAVGCLLYQLIFGKLPFPTNSKEEYIKAIKDEQISWDSQISMSPECKKLIQNMLKFNPDERITFVQIYSHPFFKDYCLSNIGVDSIIIQANQDNSVENQQFYDIHSQKINEYIIKDSQQLQQNLQKVTFPKTEQIHSLQELQLLLIEKQLKIIQYFANTVQEISKQTQKFPLDISLALSSKVYTESLRIQNEINDIFINDNDNEKNELKAKLKDLISVSVEQFQEFKQKRHFDNQPSIINHCYQQLLFQSGIEFLYQCDNQTFRVHKHILECIKNRDLQNTTFDPDLEFDFEGQDQQVNIQNDLSNLLQ